ncbi:hypothetical protein PINS_up003698 [Pythium insidiosum]|nr:hypothetical protein PINS_up003698 [Pythium insidiosum]
MRGASFLCPLLSRDDGESEPRPTPAQVHPLPPPDPTTDQVDAMRLGVMLQAVQSDLVGQHDATPLSDEVMRALPVWMQRVARTGCFGEQTRLVSSHQTVESAGHE